MAPLLHLFLLCSIYFTPSSSATSNNGGFTVDLIHRDPPTGDVDARFHRLRRAIDRSFSRKSSLLSSLQSSSSPISVTAPITYSVAVGEYLMKFMIGTPPVEQIGIVDTGSDLTWTQCLPCTPCYRQSLPLFNPSKSSTYGPISCQSVQCQCGGDNRCVYQIFYGDKSSTSGNFATETLNFGGNVNFTNFKFGCGHKNADPYASGEYSGLVGLGGGSISTVNQLGSFTGRKFSYCLALFNSNAPSRISFGSNAVVAGPNVVSTPMVTKNRDTFYFLTLEGISVGQTRVGYGAGGSAAEGFSKGNIIIDSGTTLTYLPESIYGGVEMALEAAIKADRASDPRGTMRLCYLVGGGIDFPTVTAHFEGADLELEKESVFKEVVTGTKCLTMLPSQNLAIFGNLHQMNYHIGYDLVNRKVSFLKTDCAKV